MTQGWSDDPSFCEEHREREREIWKLKKSLWVGHVKEWLTWKAYIFQFPKSALNFRVIPLNSVIIILCFCSPFHFLTFAEFLSRAAPAAVVCWSPVPRPPYSSEIAGETGEIAQIFTLNGTKGFVSGCLHGYQCYVHWYEDLSLCSRSLFCVVLTMMKDIYHNSPPVCNQWAWTGVRLCCYWLM